MGCNCGNNKKISNLANKIKQMAKNNKYKLAKGVKGNTTLILRGLKVKACDMTQQTMKAYYEAGHSSIVLDVEAPKKDK